MRKGNAHTDCRFHSEFALRLQTVMDFAAAVAELLCVRIQYSSSMPVFEMV
jgi:hypothetical protein